MIKNEIGHNAGKVWGILNEKGELPLKTLKATSGFTEKDLYLALGWLAREGKVFMHEKKKELNVCLTG